MSKMLAATCTAGVVKVGDLVVEATILSQGEAASSSGVVFLDGESSFYVASNASDIKTLIEKLGECLDKIITISTGFDAATGNTQAANIVLLLALKVQLLAQKDLLI